MPAGNAAPPRPRRPDSISSSQAAAPSSVSAAQPFQAAVREVVVDRQRIGDADAREGQPLLLLQVGQFIDQADARRMFAALEPAGVEQRTDLGRVEIRVADATGRRGHLDQRLQPEQATRAVADQLDRQAARGGLGRDGTRQRLGADGQRGRIAGNVNADCGLAHAGSLRSAAASSASKRAAVMRA